MLRSLDELKGYVLKAEDDEIGRCNDFLIDDETWAVRYMVADTRKWLPGRQVLISPIALGDPEWTENRFPIRLSRKQIENAPELDERAPVSREYEMWYHQHYGWPYYWAGSGLWASSVHPGDLYRPDSNLDDKKPDIEHPHLHSARETLGYAIGATDGEIGHVDDFILQDDTWTIRYVVAATRNWLPGKKVLIPVARLESVDWMEGKLEVDLTRDKIADCPEYDPSLPINREVEERIYDYVGRPKEWS